jgi:hypothetical protein
MFLLFLLVIVFVSIVVNSFAIRNDNALQELTNQLNDIHKRSNLIDQVHENMAAIRGSHGLTIEFYPIGKGNSQKLYDFTRRLFSNAKRCYLVLNHHLTLQVQNGETYDRDMKSSEHRRKYYQDIEDLLEEKLDEFTYLCLIQIPTDRPLSEIDDPILLSHVEKIAVISRERSEFANTKRCPLYFEGTFIITDENHLFWQVVAYQPDEREYITEGFLYIYDPDDQIIRHFRKLFERYYAQSVIIRPSDIEE